MQRSRVRLPSAPLLVSKRNLFSGPRDVAKISGRFYRVPRMECAHVSRIPSYRRHKPSKQAVVTLYSKDFYLGRYGTKDSRELYDKLVSDYLKSKGEKVPPELFHAQRPSKHITVLEAADRYLTRSRSSVEKAHVRGMLRCLVKLYENERAANIGPVELRKIRLVMIANGWSGTRKRSLHFGQRAGLPPRWSATSKVAPQTPHPT